MILVFFFQGFLAHLELFVDLVETPCDHVLNFDFTINDHIVDEFGPLVTTALLYEVLHLLLNYIIDLLQFLVVVVKLIAGVLQATSILGQECVLLLHRRDLLLDLLLFDVDLAQYEVDFGHLPFGGEAAAFAHLGR